jgi:hypothetical protein|tara:strand:- start:1636 stop:1776 length:141 start_codon:yes stop_codon:yes gene_type:complete
MPELKYGSVVNYKDITDMEGYYENSEDNQNRDSDAKQGVDNNKESE